MENNVLGKVEAFDNLLSAEGFKDGYIHKKFKEMFEVEEKDTWNLAEIIDIPENFPSGAKVISVINAKRFVQKVKEDMVEYQSGEKTLCVESIHQIIDKRAGDLK